MLAANIQHEALHVPQASWDEMRVCTSETSKEKQTHPERVLDNVANAHMSETFKYTSKNSRYEVVVLQVCEGTLGVSEVIHPKMTMIMMYAP